MQPTKETEWFEPIAECKDGFCPMPQPKVDLVNHPPHYKGENGVECIEAIEAALTPEEFRGYVKGNCIKYLWRERSKGGVESLKKANWDLTRLLNLLG